MILPTIPYETDARVVSSAPAGWSAGRDRHLCGELRSLPLPTNWPSLERMPRHAPSTDRDTHCLVRRRSHSDGPNAHAVALSELPVFTGTRSALRWLDTAD